MFEKPFNWSPRLRQLHTLSPSFACNNAVRSEVDQNPTGNGRYLPGIMFSCHIIVLHYNALWNVIFGMCLCVGEGRFIVLVVEQRSGSKIQ